MLKSADKVASISRQAIFGCLSPSTLAQISESCAWRQYDAGEPIISYQDESTDVAFLVAGKARAIIYSPEGKPVVFTELSRDAMFGEIAAIDGKARSASVEAEEPCTVAFLPARLFQRLLLSEPTVAVATLRHVAADVRRLSDRIFEFSTLAVRNRIHAELLRLAGKRNAHNDAAVISPAPSLSDIAYRISTHREAVSRELSRLTSTGLLRREGGDLLITGMRRLEKMVHESKGD